MTVSKNRGISYEAVAEACDHLVASGCKTEQLSSHRIRAKTKTGSLSTIMKHRERWFQERQKSNFVLPSTSDENLRRIRPAGKGVSPWNEGDALTMQSLLQQCGRLLTRVLDKNRELRAQNRTILRRSEELERALVSVESRNKELLAEIRANALQPWERVVDTRPLQHIPPDPSDVERVDPKPQPPEGLDR